MLMSKFLTCLAVTVLAAAFWTVPAMAADVNTAAVDRIRAQDNGSYWIRFVNFTCGGGGSETYLSVPATHSNKEGLIRLATAALLSGREVTFKKTGSLNGTDRCEIIYLQLQ